MGSRSLWVPFLLAGVAASARPASAQKDDDQFVAIAAGGYHSLALGGDGTVWGWGHNPYGQLGRFDCSPFPIPADLSEVFLPNEAPRCGAGPGGDAG